MKVVHICRKLNGGAGLCAARIMDATRKLGIDARAVVAYGNKSEYVDVVEEQIQWLVLPPLKRSQFLMRAHTWLTQNHRINKVSKSVKYRFIFSSPVTHYTNIADHPWVQEADIIHLHYIGEFVDYKSFFKKVKKPFVWTMHDQNPGLGGLDFQKWKDEGSPQAWGGEKDRAAYACSKGVLLTLVNHICQNYACDHIRANYLTLGWTPTEGEVALRKTQGMSEVELRKWAGAQHPMGRMCECADYIDTLVLLMSDGASMVSGSILRATGGWRI